MIDRKSLFYKYFLICTAVILISFICLGAVLLLISSNYFNSEKTTMLEKSAENLSRGLSELMLEKPGSWKNSAQIRTNEYGKNAGINMLVIGEDGKVVLTSELNNKFLSLKDRQYDREFLASLKEEPTSVYINVDSDSESNTLAVGIKFKGHGPYYYIIAIPSDDPYNHSTRDIMEIFVLSSVIVLILSIVIIYLTTIKITAPIKEMSNAAKKIGRGEFDIQLPEYAESEYNDLAAAFNEMAASLKSYDTMRNSFIANVSHELRTPMTSIGGFVDGLLDNTIPPEEQKHYLQIISSEVHRLTRLVRSMLNLAKIESGELKPNLTSFSVLDPIVDTLVTFEKRLEEKNIEVRGLDTDKRYYLWADADLVHQVVYNLMENAIKFVDIGGYISFRFEEVGYLTVIYIRNSGEGLSQDELSLVFDRFYKTDKSRSMDANGVGLGLNIVKSIIKLHGGKIQVRSVQGEYTEFMFSLPNKDIED